MNNKYNNSHLNLTTSFSITFITRWNHYRIHVSLWNLYNFTSFLVSCSASLVPVSDTHRFLWCSGSNRKRRRWECSFVVAQTYGMNWILTFYPWNRQESAVRSLLAFPASQTRTSGNDDPLRETILLSSFFPLSSVTR